MFYSCMVESRQNNDGQVPTKLTLIACVFCFESFHQVCLSVVAAPVPP